jgi:hypothetical protein
VLQKGDPTITPGAMIQAQQTINPPADVVLSTAQSEGLISI